MKNLFKVNRNRLEIQIFLQKIIINKENIVILIKN